MPFLEEDQDQNKDPNNQQNAVPAGQGSGLVLPNAGAQAQGSQSPSNSQSTTQPSSSGSYTNLQKYLDVNQDQAKPLADKVAAPVTQAQNEASTAADSAVDQFKGQVQAQVPEVNQQELQQIQPSKYQAGSGYQAGAPFSYVSPVGQLATLPVGFLPDQDRENIKKAQKASYQGPNTIEDTGLLQPAYDKAQQASDLAANVGTEAGRFTALQNMVKDPQYSQGQRSLDQAILETNPNVQTQFQQLQQSASALPQQIQDKAAAANQVVDPAKQQIATQANDVRSAVQKALDQYMENLNLETADAASSRTGDYQNLLNMVQGWQKGGNLTPEQQSQAYQAIYGQARPQGVSSNGDLLSQYSGVNLAPYIQQSAAPTMNQIAGQNDIAEVRALQDLLGDDRQLIGDNPKPYLPSTKFNSANLEKDLLGKLSDYKQGSKIYPTISQNGGWNVGTPSDRGALDSMLASLQQDNALRQQIGLKPIDLSSVTGVNNPDWKAQNTDQEAALSNILSGLYNQTQAGALNDNYVKQFFEQPTGNVAPLPQIAPSSIPVANGDGTFKRNRMYE